VSTQHAASTISRSTAQTMLILIVYPRASV
jgi:hypothetical protein